MDLTQIPKPVWYILTGFLLLTIGYGAAKHVPGLNDSAEKSAETKTEKASEKAPETKSVKFTVLDEKTQTVIAGAPVIMESENGSDTDTTDNLGAFRVEIPGTNYVRVRINKNNCEPYNQNLNLLSNPDRPKQILLKCNIPTNKPTPNK
jgi:hypothetical protein